MLRVVQTSLRRVYSRSISCSAAARKMAAQNDIIRMVDDVCLAANGGMPPSARMTARRVCEMYRHLPAGGRLNFANHLATAHAVSHDRLSTACAAYLQNEVAMHRNRLAERLITAAQPRAMHFIHAVGGLEKGVKFLVDFRADVRRMMLAGEPVAESTAAGLHALDHWLRDAIALWFSVGMLRLQRITWHSSCDMMEMIRDGEAVHPVRNLADMKRRVGLGRRCFVFTHPAMPRQPLVVLHVALMDRIEHNIQNVLGEYDRFVDSSRAAKVGTEEDIREIERPILQRATTALFYSISKMQPGLSGIDLGNELIKRVVSELRHELPRLQRFSTLSPVPGFAAWLRTKLLSVEQDLTNPIVSDVLSAYVCSWLPDAATCGARDTMGVRAALAALLADENWIDDDNFKLHMAPVLLHWAASYLCRETHRNRAVCPVATKPIPSTPKSTSKTAQPTSTWATGRSCGASTISATRRPPAGGAPTASWCITGFGTAPRYFLDKLAGNADGYAAGGEIWHSYKVKELLDFEKCLKRYAVLHPSPRHKL